MEARKRGDLWKSENRAGKEYHEGLIAIGVNTLLGLHELIDPVLVISCRYEKHSPNAAVLAIHLRMIPSILCCMIQQCLIYTSDITVSYTGHHCIIHRTSLYHTPYITVQYTGHHCFIHHILHECGWAAVTAMTSRALIQRCLPVPTPIQTPVPTLPTWTIVRSPPQSHHCPHPCPTTVTDQGKAGANNNRQPET